MADDLIQFDGGVLVADMLQESTSTDASELTQYAIENGSLISDHLIRQPQTLSLTLVQTETPISETTGFARAVQALSYAAHADGTQPGSATVRTRSEVPQQGHASVRQPEFRPTTLLALGAAVQALLFGKGPSDIDWTGLGKGEVETKTSLKWTGLRSDLPAKQQSLQVHVLAAGAPVARVNEFHASLLNLLTTGTPCIVTVKGRSYLDLVLTTLTRTDPAGQAGRATFTVEFKQIATVETKTVNLPPVPKAKGPKDRGNKPTGDADDNRTKAAKNLDIIAGRTPP
jgi:hypothetical protein